MVCKGGMQSGGEDGLQRGCAERGVGGVSGGMQSGVQMGYAERGVGGV